MEPIALLCARCAKLLEGEEQVVIPDLDAPPEEKIVLLVHESCMKDGEEPISRVRG